MKTKKISRWGIAAALCGVALVAACEGENLFDADSNPFIEPRVSLFAPVFAEPGDSVTVSLQASAALNLQSIAFVARGAVTKDTLIITPAARAATGSVKLGIPASPATSTVVVSAVAIDARGQASTAATDTVLIVTGN
jgi:hypothetical protein